MNALKELLDQLKADTRDRSTMVLLLFAAVALVAAVAWVAAAPPGAPSKPPAAAVVARRPPSRRLRGPVANRSRHGSAARKKARASHGGSPRDPFEALYVSTKTENGSGGAGTATESAGASKNVPAPPSKEGSGGGEPVPTPKRRTVTRVTATTKVSAEAEGQNVPLEIVNKKILRAKKPASQQMLLELVKVDAHHKTVTLKLGKNVHPSAGLTASRARSVAKRSRSRRMSSCTSNGCGPVKARLISRSR